MLEEIFEKILLNGFLKQTRTKNYTIIEIDGKFHKLFSSQIIGNLLSFEKKFEKWLRHISLRIKERHQTILV